MKKLLKKLKRKHHKNCRKRGNFWVFAVFWSQLKLFRVEVEEAPVEAPEAPPAELDVGVVVSCPDIQADDFQPGDLEKYELGGEKKKR